MASVSVAPAATAAVVPLLPPSTVSLTIDKSVISAGQSATLTATVDQPLQDTSSAVTIWDLSTEAAVRTCTSGLTCAASAVFYTGGAHTYVARVNGLVSGVVTLERAAWSVSLSIDRTSFVMGQSVTLTATTNQQVGYSNNRYRMWIKDVATGVTVGSCSNATSAAGVFTCGVTLTYYADGAHEYQAYIASYSDIAADVQATSNTVSTARAAWSVSLAINRTSFVMGQSVRLTATTNQQVWYSNNRYRMWIKDVATGVTVGSCSNATSAAGVFTCEVTLTYYADGAHEYQAYIASYSDIAADVQATSNTVNTRRAAWWITLTTSRSSSRSGESVRLTATTNQQVWYSNNRYRMWIKDVTTGETVGSCSNATPAAGVFTCEVTLTLPVGAAHRYVAVIASYSDPAKDVQATSNGLTAPNAGGPMLPGETAGGSNLSEPSSQGCHCDPVNSASGEFWESTSDLSVAGTGPGLSWSRSFATTRAATDGPLGYGWSGAYGLVLAPSGGTDLATAPWVQVIQENGSVVTFTADGLGGFTAPSRVLASLERLADGTYRFTRGQRQVYSFSAAGVLTGLWDLNGNTTTLTYEGAHLVRVDSSHGQSLEVAWSGERVAAVSDQTGRQVSYTYSAAGDLVGVVLADGSRKSYTYDSSHRVPTMTGATGGVTTNVYDTSSRVTKQTDPLGRATTFAYATGQTTITDPTGAVIVEKYTDGQMVSETKAAGTPIASTTTFTYGPTNHVESSTDALGRVTRFTYDDRGNRTSSTDPLGRVATSTYDQWNNPTSVTNGAGETTTRTYDGHGNLLTSVAADGGVTTFTVNPDGTIATATDPLGRTSSFTYDAHGFTASATGPDGSTAFTHYDTLGNLLSSTDPRGAVPGADAGKFTSTFTYDAAGRRLTGTDPLGGLVASVYDAAGHPTSVTDAAGAATTSESDLAGQLVAVTDASGARTTMTYDGAGRALTVTDAAGATTSTAYDALGRPIAVTDALGRVSRTEYDAADRVTARVTPSGARTTYTYDAADQLLTVTNPLGKVTTTTYDLAGRPVMVTDADGRAATSTYDKAGRVVSVLRADGSTLRWSYNLAGQVTAATDASGAKSTYTYDSAGRRATSMDTAGRTTAYAYDGAGHVTALTQPDGAVTTYTYDAVGRRTAADYSDATPDVSTAYDVAGRATTVTDGTGTTSYTYDVLGRVLQVARGGSSVGYTWDNVNQLTALTYPTGDVVHRTYDAAGQLTKVTDWAGRDYTYARNLDGQTEQVTYPNGVVTSYAHDTAGQTAGVVASSGSGEELLALAYGYTGAGLMADQTTTRSTQSRAPPATATTSSAFTWDALGRIAQVAGQGAGTFTFDAAGSVTTLADGRALAYDAARQLTALTTPAGADTPAGTSTFTYDGRGNRATATTGSGPAAGTTAYTYDQANQVTSIAGIDGTTTAYTYAASGLRASATTTTGGQATVEQFTWDTLAGVPALLTDASHAYIYGTGPAPLAQVSLSDATVDYLHTDTLGSVRTTTNAAGAVTSDADYDTYGRPQAVTAVACSTITRFGYAGQYTDPTGYLYLRARYYDPATAQFLTRDPVEATTGNPYGYTGGNPLQYADPLGLDWLQDAGDWTAAFGDTITFGGTKQIRILMGTDQTINTCSDFYAWGGNGGTIASLVPIGGGGAKAAAFVGEHLPALASAGAKAATAFRTATAAARSAVAARFATAMAAGAEHGSANFLARAGAADTAGAQRVFWSGGQTAQSAAEKWAAENGGVTLEMTSSGRAVSSATREMPWSEAKPMWDQASADFARGAAGTVEVFHNAAGVSLNSAWRNVEYPILERNGVDMNFHTVGEGW
jgi:RHS repeat-associated protein